MQLHRSQCVGLAAQLLSAAMLSANYICRMGLSIALLRAVNVGTANRVRMETLRAVFGAAGYPGAVTHIQSGNVIFETNDDEAAAAAKIERQITTDLGLSIVAILRSAAALADVARHHHLAISDGDPAQLYVAFLGTEATADDVNRLSAMSFGDDALVLAGREVFVRYASRPSQSKLTGAVIERKLARQATMRNWGVVTKLVELTS